MTGQRDTVVVPCAGAGRRLPLPFGKELIPIGSGQVLLDATLDLLAPHADRLRLVVVIDDDREATVRHIRKRCAALRLPWAFVYQPPELVESTGAVRAASEWFSTANVVLLPDQVLDAPNPGIVADALGHIREGADFCFLAARESDTERIASDGAVRIDLTTGRLLDYADKPGGARAGEFNAIWFGYAFAGAAASAVLAVLHMSTVDGRLPAEGLGPLADSPVVEVGPFANLGTWPSVLYYLAPQCQPISRRRNVS